MTPEDDPHGYGDGDHTPEPEQTEDEYRAEQARLDAEEEEEALEAAMTRERNTGAATLPEPCAPATWSELRARAHAAEARVEELCEVLSHIADALRVSTPSRAPGSPISVSLKMAEEALAE